MMTSTSIKLMQDELTQLIIDADGFKQPSDFVNKCCNWISFHFQGQWKSETVNRMVTTQVSWEVEILKQHTILRQKGLEMRL